MLLLPRIALYSARHCLTMGHVCPASAVSTMAFISYHHRKTGTNASVQTHGAHPRKHCNYFPTTNQFSTSCLFANESMQLQKGGKVSFSTTSGDTNVSSSAHKRPVDAPFFPIYYNDVYEVDLPPGHRFPMEKYKKVRKKLQAKIEALDEEEQDRTYCGEILIVWQFDNFQH